MKISVLSAKSSYSNRHLYNVLQYETSDWHLMSRYWRYQQWLKLRLLFYAWPSYIRPIVRMHCPLMHTGESEDIHRKGFLAEKMESNVLLHLQLNCKRNIQQMPRPLLALDLTILFPFLPMCTCRSHNSHHPDCMKQAGPSWLLQTLWQRYHKNT